MAYSYPGISYPMPAGTFSSGKQPAVNAQFDYPGISVPQPKGTFNGGQVLGASTGGGSRISQQEALNKGWDWNNLPSGYSQQQSAQADDYANRARSEINAGFDAYTAQLDSMLGSIPGQQKGQEQIVENNYNQGVSDINAQKTQGMADLATQRRKTGEQQVKTLADIADNIRSLFQTGNVMLGTRGAGDSSAADRYSYAVTKLGSKQRGDVLAQTRSIENDIADREARLTNIVTQETSKLKTNRDNQIVQIAQYFQDKMNEIAQAKAQGALQRGQSLASLSTQLLQFAQQQLMTIDADFRNRQNSLLSWAESNSKNIGELKSNLAAIGQYNAPAITRQAIAGAPTFDAQGNMSAPLTYGGGYGGSSDNELQRRVF